MYKVLYNFSPVFLASLVFFLLLNFVYASEITEIIEISNDSTLILYDEEAISDWDQARGFQGELFNEPLEEGRGVNFNKVGIRSDRGVGTYRIYRHSQLIDLGSLPENALITDARLMLYGTEINNIGNAALVVTSHERADVDVLQKADWPIQNFGEEFARANIVIGDYAPFNFNNGGLEYLQNRIGQKINLGIITEFDYDNIDPGAMSASAGFFSIENEGTSQDPYLEITYEIPGEPGRPLLQTQIESPFPSVEETSEWADDLYAAATPSSGYYCGSTIAACGCAITSVTMMGLQAGVVEDVLGDAVTPGNINTYLKQVYGGFQSGNTSWLASQAYLGEFNQAGEIVTRFLYDGTIKTNVMSETGAALAAGQAVLGFKDGHFVYVVGKDGDDYTIRDPLWYNTRTANDTDDRANDVRNYNNDFDSIRVFDVFDEPQSIPGHSIEAEVLSDTVELLFTSVVGDVVGSVDGQTVIDLDRSSYSDVDIISIDGVSSDAPVGKHLLVYDSGSEFTIDVVGTGIGEYTFQFFTLNNKGETQSFTATGKTYPGVTTTFVFDLETGDIAEEPLSPDSMSALLDAVLGDLTAQQQKFFRNWIDKFFAKTETKTVSQLLQQLEVLEKLFVAKKVEHPLAPTVVDVLTEYVD